MRTVTRSNVQNCRCSSMTKPGAWLFFGAKKRSGRDVQRTFWAKMKICLFKTLWRIDKEKSQRWLNFPHTNPSGGIRPVTFSFPVYPSLSYTGPITVSTWIDQTQSLLYHWQWILQTTSLTTSFVLSVWRVLLVWSWRKRCLCGFQFPSTFLLGRPRNTEYS